MKLAISGSSSIGKTTLAIALAKKLQLALINEEYSAIFKGPDTRYANTLNETRELKLSLEQKHQEGFITDRCAIDLFHLWNNSSLQKRINESNSFFNKILHQLKHYDFIIIPPWGVIKLVALEEATGNQARNLNPWVQLRNHATIMGYIHLLFPKKNIIEIPTTIKTTDERIEFIIRVMKKRKPEIFKNSVLKRRLT